MTDLQNLLFGGNAKEPLPQEAARARRQIQELERLACFVETENLEVAPQVPGQMQKVRDDQIENAAGGFVFKVNDVNRIRRFLMLGTSGGTYYTSEKELTMDNIKDLCKIIQKGNGVTLLKEILEISLSGRAPKQDSTLFALALCARYKVCDTRDKKTLERFNDFAKREFVGSDYDQQAPVQAYLDYQKGLQAAALLAVPKVCRIPTHLFMFIKYCKLVSSQTGMKEKSSGWGRSLRQTISNWYFNFLPERLAVHVTKYQNREGYTHRDLFRLCHITPKTNFPDTHNYWSHHAEYDFLFNYIVRGSGEVKKRKADKKSGEEAEKKRKIAAEMTEAGDKKMEVDSAVGRDTQEAQKAIRDKVKKVFSENWSEGMDDATKEAIQEKMDAFVKDTTCALVRAERKKAVEAMKEKVRNVFRENWDEGLDAKTRKAIQSKMQSFVAETTSDIIMAEQMRLLMLEKKTECKGAEQKEIEGKKKAMPLALESTKTYRYIKAFEAMKSMTDPAAVVKMIKEYEFVREHVPTDLLNSYEVWSALLLDMPMTAMIRNLGKMASIGLLTAEDKNQTHVNTIVTKLTDEKAIHDARIHPLGVLLASSVYKAGRGVKGALKWEPIDRIKGALDQAFLLAFKNVTPTNKRYCLALDVSGSMCAQISGTHLNCREASCALSTVLLRTEPEVEAVAFTSELTELNLNKSMSMDQIIQRISDMEFGSTDCAQPMLWAMEKKKKFDVFVVYTDNETWFGKVHPFEALKQYRKAMEIPDARLVVMGMTATDCSIADPTDAGMLDICGFDSAVPELLKEFVLGNM